LVALVSTHASAAPWIVTNPVNIEGDLYTDGGLLETYPIKYVNKCQADITVIVGFDQEHFSFIPQKNGNLLQYLANLIDIGRFNSINSILTKQLIENDSGVIAIANPMHITFIDFIIKKLLMMDSDKVLILQILFIKHILKIFKKKISHHNSK
jgi:predicted acylesterase/phospholipase RssA